MYRAVLAIPPYLAVLASLPHLSPSYRFHLHIFKSAPHRGRRPLQLVFKVEGAIAHQAIVGHTLAEQSLLLVVSPEEEKIHAHHADHDKDSK